MHQNNHKMFIFLPSCIQKNLHIAAKKKSPPPRKKFPKRPTHLHKLKRKHFYCDKTADHTSVKASIFFGSTFFHAYTPAPLLMLPAYQICISALPLFLSPFKLAIILPSVPSVMCIYLSIYRKISRCFPQIFPGFIITPLILLG